MKNKNRIIVLILWTSLICCFMSGVSEGTERCETSISESGYHMEALQWGFMFASAIPVKPHVVDRSKSQYDALRAYLDCNMPDQAAEQAGCIADWHKCLCYADLSMYYVQKAEVEKIQHYLQQARDCCDELTGWQKSWQKDRVLLRIAEVQVMAGQLENAEKTEAELPADIVDMARIIRFSRLNAPEDYGKAVKQLQSMESSGSMEVKRDIAKAYIGILRQLGTKATKEHCDFLRTRVYDVSQQLPRLIEHEILRLLSRTAFSANQQETGRNVLEYAEKQVKKHNLKARYDVKSLAALAEIWHQEARHPKRCDSLLREAGDLLNKSGLKGIYRVPALISLAKGYGIQKKHDTAWDYFRQSLEAVRFQKNARPRAMALTEICVAMGRCGCSVPEDIQKEFKQFYKELGRPW